MKTNTALPERYTNQLFTFWQEVIDRNEICTVLTPPIFANDYRVHNFLDWQEKNKYKKCKYINFHLDLIYDPEDVKKIFENSEQPIIISMGEFLLEKNSLQILAALIHYKILYNRAIVIFFESTITELKNLPTQISHTLLQNVSYISLFSFETTKHFCKHIAQRWKFKISDQQVRDIYEYSGGHVWLVKEVLRQLAKKDDLLQNIFSSQEIQFKKEKIWESLGKEHKEYLVKVDQKFYDQQESQNLIFKDLFNLGFIKHEKPFIPGFILELSASIQHSIVVKNSEFYFNDICVTSFFSKKEQELFLAFYYATENKISREDLGKLLWGQTEGGYTDWALDKTVSRLRAKLNKLGISGKALVTLREQGYQLLLK